MLQLYLVEGLWWQGDVSSCVLKTEMSQHTSHNPVKGPVWGIWLHLSVMLGKAFPHCWRCIGCTRSCDVVTCGCVAEVFFFSGPTMHSMMERNLRVVFYSIFFSTCATPPVFSTLAIEIVNFPREKFIQSMNQWNNQCTVQKCIDTSVYREQ